MKGRANLVTRGPQYLFASMFSAIGEILSRIAMQVTIDRLKVAVQMSLKSLGADHVGCSWQINIEDPSYYFALSHMNVTRKRPPIQRNNRLKMGHETANLTLRRVVTFSRTPFLTSPFCRRLDDVRSGWRRGDHHRSAVRHQVRSANVPLCGRSSADYGGGERQGKPRVGWASAG